jgi:Domain of unknown function (DUF4326)
MPANTVKVDRSTRWGNPFRVTSRTNLAESITMFEHWLKNNRAGRRLAREAAIELKGKNLACWCPLDGPCHAEILLRVANQESG